jgi:hypothetical protein
MSIVLRNYDMKPGVNPLVNITEPEFLRYISHLDYPMGHTPYDGKQTIDFSDFVLLQRFAYRPPIRVIVFFQKSTLKYYRAMSRYPEWHFYSVDETDTNGWEKSTVEEIRPTFEVVNVLVNNNPPFVAIQLVPKEE